MTGLGRIFSAIWIICGITLCSVLTASMTDVIHQVTLPKTPTLAAKVINIFFGHPNFVFVVSIMIVSQEKDGR